MNGPEWSRWNDVENIEPKWRPDELVKVCENYRNIHYKKNKKKIKEKEYQRFGIFAVVRRRGQDVHVLLGIKQSK